MPVILGTVERHPDGGSTIRLRLHVYAMMFLAPWIALVVAVAHNEPPLLIPTAILLGITCVSFCWGARKGVRIIREAVTRS